MASVKKVASSGVSGRIPVGVLLVISLSIIMLVLISLASGILHIRFVQKQKQRAEPVIESQSHILSILPPWLSGDGLQQRAPRKILIMQGLHDMHFFNGLQIPQTYSSSLSKQVHAEAESDRVPRRYDRSQQTFEILQCLTCPLVNGQAWIAAISNSGLALAALAKKTASQSAYASFNPLKRTTIDRWIYVDFGIPVGCHESHKLKYFIQLLSNSVRAIRPQVRVRILITRFPCDDKGGNAVTRDELESISFIKKRKTSRGVGASNITEADSVVFIRLNDKQFSKDKAIIALHENTNKSNSRSLLIVIDADTYIDIQFVYAAMAFVSTGVSAYFPIVWSAYHPRSIKAAFTFKEAKEIGLFDEDQGVWRMAGFAVYAIASVDAARLAMKGASDFQGWPSEGRDLFTGPISKTLHIVRKLERGLIHMWHPRLCQFQTSIRRVCLRSVAYVEGSPLSIHIKLNPVRFPKGLPISESSKILIAVKTWRVSFSKRIASLASTWANKLNMPSCVTLKYFVGRQDAFPSATRSGEFFFKRELALRAGLTNDPRIFFDVDESIVILNGVKDDEYPPFSKDVAMLKALSRFISSGSEMYRWIVVVDDDTFLHIMGLQRLVQVYDPSNPILLGHNRLGRVHDKENVELIGPAFCIGSPAYVMNHVMLSKLVNQLMSSCLQDGRALRPSSLSATFWQSIVIDMCMEKVSLLSVGCQRDGASSFRHYSDRKTLFKVRGKKASIVSLHPVDNVEDMPAILKRFNLQYEATSWLD